MDDPLIRAERKQAIEGQIHALADTHTGVALEEQEITEEIIAALQFLLDELILFRQQWTRGVFIPARAHQPERGDEPGLVSAGSMPGPATCGAKR